MVKLFFHFTQKIKHFAKREMTQHDPSNYKISAVRTHGKSEKA